MECESVNSLSDFRRLQLAKSARFSQPLSIIPPAAILHGGALSGTFHPNGVRRKDTIITADTSRCGHAVRRRISAPLLTHLQAACRRQPGALEKPLRRDALSWRPLRLPETGPDPAQHVARRACPSDLLVFPLVSAT
jgi:hypothetical protein